MTDEVTAPETPQPVETPAAAQPAPAAPVPTVQPADTPDLKAVAEALLSEVPEQMRSLIPQIEPAQQIKWYTDAKAAGAFSTGAPAVPETDSGKPTVTPVEPNLDDLPPSARMSRGYGQ